MDCPRQKDYSNETEVDISRLKQFCRSQVTATCFILLFLQAHLQLVTAEDTDTLEKQPGDERSERKLVKRDLNGFQRGFQDGYELASRMNHKDKSFNSREIPHKYADEPDQGHSTNLVPLRPRQRSPKLVIGSSSSGGIGYRSRTFNSESENGRHTGVRYGNSGYSRDLSSTSGLTSRGSHHPYGHENTRPANRHMHTVPNTYEKSNFGPRDITLGHSQNQDGSATGVYVKNGHDSGYGIGMVRDRQTGTVLSNEGDTFGKGPLTNSGSDYLSGTRSDTRNHKATDSAESDFGPRDIAVGRSFNQEGTSVGVYVKNGYASGYGVGMVKYRHSGTVLSNEGHTFGKGSLRNSGSDYSSGERSFRRNQKATDSTQTHSAGDVPNRGGARAFSNAVGFASGEKVIFGAVSTDNESRRGVSVENGSFSGHAFAKI